MTLNLAFQVFWVILAGACLIVIRLPAKERSQTDRRLFLAAAACLVAFAAFRPFGVGLDDLNGYATLQYEVACPALKCGRFIQGSRDFGWYSIVGLLKSFYPDARVVLWLSGLGLVLKLWIVDRLCRHRTLALLFYFSCFYIIHDITALRISLAIGVYLLGFYFLTQGRTLWGGGVLVGNVLFHVQAIFAPLLLAGRWLDLSSPVRLTFFLLLPLTLLAMALYPNDDVLRSLLSQPSGRSVADFLFGSSYVGWKLDGRYENFRLLPVVVPPTLLVAAWLLGDLSKLLSALNRYAAASLLIGAWFLWGYAVIPDVQLRVWHFFLVPLVFVIGNVQLTAWKMTAIVVLSGVYLLKYTVMNDLLLDQRHVRVEQTRGGQVKIANLGIVQGIDCGPDCGMSYTEGTKIVLSAKAETGYLFDHWLSGCEGVTPICKLVVNEDTVASAAFVPARSLSLNAKGQGKLAVTAAGEVIPCQLPCQLAIHQSARVELRAQPFEGFRWKQWSGACRGQGPACTWVMNGIQSVEAEFVRVHKIDIVEPMGGQIVWEDDSNKTCPGVCSWTVDEGAAIRLNALSYPGFRFAGWTSGCEGELVDCSISSAKDTQVSGRFVPIVGLTVDITGSGQVLGPLGVACEVSCKVGLDKGVSQTLKAVPAQGYRFMGWGGACQGMKPECEMNPDGALAVQASFVKIH